MIFEDNYSPKVKDELSIVKKWLFKEKTVADEVDLRNNFEHLSILADQLDFDMDKIFPIKNEKDLKEFESLILNKDHRSVLVNKLSLLITNNIGNSVRQIFSHIIRYNSKFKLTLEKEIDVPISVWLSHALLVNYFCFYIKQSY
ncbi:DUF4806 domain-containing protein, partial [Aphis craccivora]